MGFLSQEKISISVVSPLHIGCDEPFAFGEVVVCDSFLYCDLDLWSARSALDKFNSVLARSDIRDIYKNAFAQHKQDLRGFSNRALPIANAAVKELEASLAKPESPMVIMRTSYDIASCSPMVPGTSLKGVLRTGALLRQFPDPDVLQANLKSAGLRFQRDPFSLVSISDCASKHSASEALCIAVCDRVNRDTGKTVGFNAGFREFVVPGVDVFSGTVSLRDLVSDNLFKKRELNRSDVVNIADLFAIARNHTNSVLNNFGETWNCSRLAPKFNSYFERLRTEVQKDPYSALVHLGSGGGKEHASIEWVYDLQAWRKGTRGSPPKTGLVANFGEGKMLPLGWAVLTYGSNNENAEWRKVLLEFSRDFRETYGVSCPCSIAHAQAEAQKKIVAAEGIKQESKRNDEKRASERQAELARLETLSPNLRILDDLARKLAEKGKVSVGDNLYAQFRKIVFFELADWTTDEKRELRRIGLEFVKERFDLSKDKKKEVLAKLNALPE
jgi:CRISPR/Cas system CSM-associated protein Csm5 (group 7 of RAMP superfamily)